MALNFLRNTKEEVIEFKVVISTILLEVQPTCEDVSRTQENNNSEMTFFFIKATNWRNGLYFGLSRSRPLFRYFFFFFLFL